VNQEYRIKLKSEDFESANVVLIKEASVQLDEVDQDHYLFAFSDEELIQLISTRDEWSDYDFLLAQRILKERGRVLDDAELASLEERRFQELNKFEEIKPGWLYAGFLFALLGGVFGIMTGWFISSNTKTLPNGKTMSLIGCFIICCRLHMLFVHKKGSLIIYISVSMKIMIFIGGMDYAIFLRVTKSSRKIKRQSVVLIYDGFYLVRRMLEITTMINCQLNIFGRRKTEKMIFQ